MINTEFYRGGAAKIARTLYYELNKKEFINCYFTYGRGKQVEDRKTIKFAYLPEVYLQGLLNRCFGLQGYGSWFSTKKLEKYITKEKFDLIHLHNIHGYYLNLNFIEFLKKLEIPTVWTFHDGWPLTGRCSYFFNCEKWKTGCGYCPDLKSYPKTFLDTCNFMWRKKKEIFLTGRNPIIVCPSKWMGDKVKESYLKNFEVKVIPNAIDTDIFKPKNKRIVRKKHGIPDDKKVILYVASDLKDERKGAKYFFGSLKYINTKDWIVITLGKGINNFILIDAKAVIKQIGYFQNEKDISEIYNIADIFCISSLDDNFPTTVLEAMACGIPVVGFKVGGIPEQVTEDCGILVETKNIKSLGKALEELLNNDDLRNKLSENCRKRILENYTIDKFVNNYIDTYNKALGRSINK